MTKKIIFVLLCFFVFNIGTATKVKADTVSNLDYTDNDASTATKVKEIKQTVRISRSIAVKGARHSGHNCSPHTSGESIEYTATVTQIGKLTYIMPGSVVTAGMSFPLEVYYESEISYSITINHIPSYSDGWKDCCGCENGGCCAKCRCGGRDDVPSTMYSNGSTLRDLNGNALSIYSGDTTKAKKLAEVDLTNYLKSEYKANTVKAGLKISFPDSNKTDSNYKLQGNQERYTSWDSCTAVTYKETQGDEQYYQDRLTSDSYYDDGDYYWKRDLGWSEGKKAYMSCQLAIDDAYIERTTGNVVYSSNTNYDSNTNYLSAGQVIFTPLDMHTGSFPITIKTTNLSILPNYFSSSTWSSNDTLNIQVAQKYYNETDDLKGYDGFVFYYRPIALSTKSGGAYSIDPFPSNNYIPANFVKWLYINGDTGNGTNSSAGLLNRNNQYQRNWQRLTQDYLNGKMSRSTAEYYTNLSRTFISTIQEYNDSVSYLNNSLRANGYSTFVERYRNYITRNDNPSRLGEVKTDDWQVLTRE